MISKTDIFIGIEMEITQEKRSKHTVQLIPYTLLPGGLVMSLDFQYLISISETVDTRATISKAATLPL